MAASLAGAAACDSAGQNPGGDAGIDSPVGDAGGDDDQCVGDNEAGSGDAWTAMALIDDTSNPARVVRHAGNDVVSGIYYESADKGIIVSQDDIVINPLGGAVFNATGSAVTAIAFSGDNTGTRHEGTIDFTGIEKSPTGYIAMAYASEVIKSSDGGATFQIEGNAGVGRFSIDRTLAYQVTATGTTLVVDNGVISASSAAPGPDASYDDVWTSSQSHPAGQCKDGPRSATSPTLRYSVYVSPDRMFIAYTSAPGQDPTICISTDGGRSFTARSLGITTSTTAPSGVMFMTKKRGIAWYATNTGGSYIKRTVDGGATWTTAALPAELASSTIELPAGFLGTDCKHGWLAGFDGTATRALLLSTSDGGATWSKVPGVGEAVEAAHGNKLYSGFALDTAHIWLGGARGVVVHN